MITTAIPRYRFLGITDECVTCQQCGKPNLRSTVVLSILDDEGNDVGELTYYGSTCAARALGQTGRAAARIVLGKARSAHYKLVMNAYDARQMLAHYTLPETGEATEQALRQATLRYWNNHRNAMWAHEKTDDAWRAMTLDMLARYQAALADADRLKVDIPADDKALQRFISSF